MQSFQIIYFQPLFSIHYFLYSANFSIFKHDLYSTRMLLLIGQNSVDIAFRKSPTFLILLQHNLYMTSRFYIISVHMSVHALTSLNRFYQVMLIIETMNNDSFCIICRLIYFNIASKKNKILCHISVPFIL